MATRSFTIRYGNWPVANASVDTKLLDGADSMTIVKRAMGHAFQEQLKGDWKEHDDCKIVLDKDNPGVWVGRRLHPKSGQKDDPFYVMEV